MPSWASPLLSRPLQKCISAYTPDVAYISSPWKFIQRAPYHKNIIALRRTSSWWLYIFIMVLVSVLRLGGYEFDPQPYSTQCLPFWHSASKVGQATCLLLSLLGLRICSQRCLPDKTSSMVGGSVHRELLCNLPLSGQRRRCIPEFLAFNQLPAGGQERSEVRFGKTNWEYSSTKPY